MSFSLFEQTGDPNDTALLLVIRAVLQHELTTCSSPSLMLRDGSLFTKLLMGYTKRVRSREYLEYLFREVVLNVLEDDELNLEMDPKRELERAMDERKNQEAAIAAAQIARNSKKKKTLFARKKSVRMASRDMESPSHSTSMRLPTRFSDVGVDDFDINRSDNSPGSRNSFIRHQENLERVCATFFDRIRRGLSMMPYAIRWLCKQIATLTESSFPGMTVTQRHAVLSGFLLTRWWIPSFLNPDYSGIVLDFPINSQHRRNLTLIAKVLKNLFTGQIFDSKEPYMMPLNEFLERQRPVVNGYWEELLSVKEPTEYFTEVEKIWSPVPEIAVSATVSDLILIHRILWEHKAVLCEKHAGLKQLIESMYDPPPSVAAADKKMVMLLVNNPLYQPIARTVSTDNCVGSVGSGGLTNAAIKEHNRLKEIVTLLISSLDPLTVMSGSSLFGSLQFIKQRICSRDEKITTPSGPSIALQLHYVMNKLEKLSTELSQDNYSAFLLELQEDWSRRKERLFSKLQTQKRGYLLVLDLVQREEKIYREDAARHLLNSRLIRVHMFIRDALVPCCLVPAESFEAGSIASAGARRSSANSGAYNTGGEKKHSKRMSTILSVDKKDGSSLSLDVNMSEELEDSIRRPLSPSVTYNDFASGTSIDCSRLTVCHPDHCPLHRMALVEDMVGVASNRRGGGVHNLSSDSIEGFIQGFSTIPELSCALLQGDDCTFGEPIQAYLSLVETRMSSHPLFQAVTVEEKEEALEEIQRYIFVRLSKRILPTTPFDEDTTLYRRIASLQWLKPHHLDIQPQHQNEDLWSLAQTALLSMDRYKSPSEKLQCIVECCRIVMNLLELCCSRDDPPGADVSFPILIYVIIKANPPRLFSNLQYILIFTPSSKMLAESGYCFIQLKSAVAFIETLNETSLSIEPDQFNKLMSESRRQEVETVKLSVEKLRRSTANSIAAASAMLTATHSQSFEQPLSRDRQLSTVPTSLPSESVDLAHSPLTLTFNSFSDASSYL
eukprot:GILJ01011247.1.p1 GENE.GILJ01011247.1~~GILJ01011247.1.p1  ORF type:complete len:1177 (-),score=184.84 GILJ01011247.1:43-3066(-)